jgi:hypothetical protein
MHASQKKPMGVVRNPRVGKKQPAKVQPTKKRLIHVCFFTFFHSFSFQWSITLKR